MTSRDTNALGMRRNWLAFTIGCRARPRVMNDVVIGVAMVACVQFFSLRIVQ